MRYLIGFMICSLVFTCLAYAPGLAITNLQIHQRYPWNGKMDILFDVQCPDTCDAYLKIHAEVLNEPSSLVPVRACTVDGIDYVTNLISSTYGHFPLQNTPGAHHIVWDSHIDAPHVQKEVVFHLSLVELNSPPTDAIGQPIGTAGDVVVIDLTHLKSETPNVSAISTYEHVDMGRFNCETYKISKLVLRKIPHGNYLLGANGSTLASTPMIFSSKRGRMNSLRGY